MKKLKLISAAANIDTNLREGAAFFIESLQSMNVLAEAVTHVLANIATKADNGQELNAMSLNSAAAFMAGVDALSHRMTNDPGPQLPNVIRALNAVKILPDGTVSDSATAIAEVGMKYPEFYTKYKRMFDVYGMSLQRGRPAGDQLSQAARALQQRVDQAMRIASAAPQRAQSSRPAPSEYPKFA